MKLLKRCPRIAENPEKVCSWPQKNNLYAGCSSFALHSQSISRYPEQGISKCNKQGTFWGQELIFKDFRLSIGQIRTFKIPDAVPRINNCGELHFKIPSTSNVFTWIALVPNAANSIQALILLVPRKRYAINAASPLSLSFC